LKKNLIMDIQTKKLHFVQEFLRLRDENLIDKLNELLKSERKKKLEKELNPFNHKEFNNLIDSAESDSANGKLTSAKELKNEIDSWN
jgi:hypothetical protein